MYVCVDAQGVNGVKSCWQVDRPLHNLVRLQSVCPCLTLGRSGADVCFYFMARGQRNDVAGFAAALKPRCFLATLVPHLFFTRKTGTGSPALTFIFQNHVQ